MLNLHYLQSVVLNTLTSEFVIINNPLPQKDTVRGVYLLNQCAFIYGKSGWCRFDLRGNLIGNHSSPEDPNQWCILGNRKKIYFNLIKFLN